MKEKITKHELTKEIIRIQRWDEKERLIWDENPKHKTWQKMEYEEIGNIVIIHKTLSSGGYITKEVRNLEDGTRGVGNLEDGTRYSKERITKHYLTKEIIRIQRWDEKYRLIWDENPERKTWWKTEYEEIGNIVIVHITSSMDGYIGKEVRNLEDEILYSIYSNGEIIKGNTNIDL